MCDGMSPKQVGLYIELYPDRELKTTNCKVEIGVYNCTRAVFWTSFKIDETN